MLSSANKRFFVLIAVIVLLALGLTSCGFEEETQVAKEACTNFLDGVLKDDFLMSYSLFEDSVRGSDFAERWDYVCDIMENSKSYELEEVGWDFTVENDVGLLTSSFEAVTDDGKVIQFKVTTDEAGLCEMNVYDTSKFVKNTKWVKVANEVMIVVSFLMLALTVWMLIDACVRRMRKKWLWIILILFGVYGEVALGFTMGYFDFKVGIVILFKSLTMYTINSVEAIGVRIAITIGTLIYFFLRKTLSAQDKAADERIMTARAAAEAKAKAEAEQAALAETAVEAEPEEEAPTEEPAEEKTEDQ